MKIAGAFLLLLTAASPQASSVDNATIVRLASAGLGDGAIIAKIRSQPCNYDTSADALIALKRSGLSDAVITTVVERCDGGTASVATAASADPLAPHKPGIYLQGKGQPLTILRPTVAGGVRTSGNGSILFPYKATLTVPQSSARLKVADARPVFWFYFDPANARVGDFGSVDTSAAQSPSEFSLVRFKDKDGGRQFAIGRAKGASQEAGIDTCTTLSVQSEEVRSGIFKVEVPMPLVPGEYAFVLPGSRGRYSVYRIYDFSVTGR